MDREHLRIKNAQKELLKAFSGKAKDFALTGGTALELYYLNHRFSIDLDFFSPKYDKKEIEAIAAGFKDYCGIKIKLENEFIAPSHAKVRFYSAHFKDLKDPIKIDFAEDVLFDSPNISKFGGVRVYSAESIYLQKITTITGIRVQIDQTGRQFMRGRREARDAFDVYMLSKKIKPLHLFLNALPSQIQMGIIDWYQTFSRHDVKAGLLDLDIYDKKFDAREMIIYLENEIKKFMKDVVR
jgi:predicted nucleotidyltransferase component of viral defense system